MTRRRDWIDEAIDTVKRKRPLLWWGRSMQPGDFAGGIVIERGTMRAAGGQELPYIMFEVERGKVEGVDREEGDVVKLPASVAYLREWFEADDPQAGDKVIVFCDEGNGSRKDVKAMVVR